MTLSLIAAHIAWDYESLEGWKRQWEWEATLAS